MDGPHDHQEINQKIAALEAKVDALHSTPPIEPPVEPPIEPPVEPPIEPPPIEPPLPLPPTGVDYIAPQGGNMIKDGGYFGKWIEFNDPQGQRLRGNATPSFRITNRYQLNQAPPEGNWYYTVDGGNVGTTIDTNLIADGPHLIGVQLIEDDPEVEPYSQIFVVNNSGVALHHTRQVWNDPFKNYSLTAVVADIADPVSVPLRWWHDQERKPVTLEDQQKLFNRKWVDEGLTHSHPCAYAQGIPTLFKNSDGDWFVGSYKPRDNNDSSRAVDYVEKCPAHDGPRGVCDLNPYSTLVHGHKILASGNMGWIGVCIDGRLFDLDITGEMTTFFGPKSVGVQTDPRVDMSLAMRHATGEKEFVGSSPTDFLKEPTDIWPDPVDEDLVWIADKGNDRIAVVSREQGKIIQTYPLPGVTSLWVCHDMRASGVRICAVSPQSGVTMFYVDSREPAVTAIPNAFWIRGKQSDTNSANSRTYVMTQTGAFYELNPNTGQSRQTITPQSGLQTFAFFDVDTTGTIGKKGDIYFSWVNSPNSNTGIGIVSPNHDGPWPEPSIGRLHARHGQISPHIDWYGHYMWGFVTHHHLSCFLSVGTAESTWMIHRAYTDRDVPNPIDGPDNIDTNPRYRRGHNLFLNGIKNEVAPLQYMFGREGGGQAGYGYDLFSYRTIEEAADYMEPFRHPKITDEDWGDLVYFLWSVSLKAHFR